jgi:Zn ribbon nucleic-acid-binding protein
VNKSTCGWRDKRLPNLIALVPTGLTALPPFTKFSTPSFPYRTTIAIKKHQTLRQMATMANVNHEMSQPTCHNCTTSTTPLWRRDEIGSVLCNACGLFLKLHGRPRPISLKTDVIKSRNRVKSSGSGGVQGAKKKVRTRLYAAADACN